MFKGNKTLHIIFIVLLLITIAEVSYYFLFNPSSSLTSEQTNVFSDTQRQAMTTESATTTPNESKKEVILIDADEKEIQDLGFPFRFTNSKSTHLHQLIPRGVVEMKGNHLQIEISMAIFPGEKASADHSNGLIITNGEVKDDFRSLALVYQKEGWNFGYLVVNKWEFFQRLFEDKETKSSRRFTIRLNKDGKKISVVFPNNQDKSFNLKESFFPFNNKVVLNVQTAPSCFVTISHLSYQEF